MWLIARSESKSRGSTGGGSVVVVGMVVEVVEVVEAVAMVVGTGEPAEAVGGTAVDTVVVPPTVVGESPASDPFPGDGMPPGQKV
jgi:hypothetical protein